MTANSHIPRFSGNVGFFLHPNIRVGRPSRSTVTKSLGAAARCGYNLRQRTRERCQQRSTAGRYPHPSELHVSTCGRS